MSSMRGEVLDATMKTDAQSTTHPLSNDKLSDLNDIMATFDDIVYDKVNKVSSIEKIQRIKIIIKRRLGN